jgi:phospholipid-binding lipoprotein MlaA
MRRSIALASSALLLFSALAPVVHAATPEDPYEAANRRRYASHDAVDRKLILPLAKLYHALTPGFIGRGIHNLLVELSEPMTFANDVLQARPKRAAKTAARFMVNALVVGGLLDVAGKGGMPHRDNDFGITLGVWGVKPGPYLFVPLVGPTTTRDLFGMVVEQTADPRNFIRYRSHLQIDLPQAVVGALDKRYNAESDLHALLADSADPYATLRSSYLQDRQANVEDREAPPANLPDIESAPEAATPPAAESAPPATEPTPAEPAPAESAPAPQTRAALSEDGPMTTAGSDTLREAAL